MYTQIGLPFEFISSTLALDRSHLPPSVMSMSPLFSRYADSALSAYRENNGDMLITDGGNWDRSNAKVEEMNSKGKPIWVYTGGLDFPHSAYPIGNDIVISDTNNDRVFEIDRSGNTIWSTDDLGAGTGDLGSGTFSDGGQLLYPNDAYPMPGNQLLISSRMNNTVWEINMSGAVSWKCNNPSIMLGQHRPRLLSNGNLMVADSDQGKVEILNHACTKVIFSDGGFLGRAVLTLTPAATISWATHNGVESWKSTATRKLSASGPSCRVPITFRLRRAENC